MCAEEYAQMQERMAKKLNGDCGGGSANGDHSSTAAAAASAVPSAPSAAHEPSAPSGIPPPAVYEKPNGANGITNGVAAMAPNPSAPPQTVDTFKSTECVICLEKKVKQKP